MTRLWRDRLSLSKGDAVAALLIALVASSWFVVSRPLPQETDSAAATSPGLQSGAIADGGRTPTAAPSPNPSVTPGLSPWPGHSPTPGPTPGPTVPQPKSPSPGPTAGPSQSQPPSPSDGATPTPTPGYKSPATPAPLPDLLAVAYGVGDGQLVCGTDNVGYVTVRNSGEGAAPAGIAVRFQLVEGKDVTWKETKTIPVALKPGESYTLRVVFRLAGSCPVDLLRTWSVSIDPGNLLAESKEDNNSAALSWKSATAAAS